MHGYKWPINCTRTRTPKLTHITRITLYRTQSLPFQEPAALFRSVTRTRRVCPVAGHCVRGGAGGRNWTYSSFVLVLQNRWQQGEFIAVPAVRGAWGWIHRGRAKGAVGATLLSIRRSWRGRSRFHGLRVCCLCQRERFLSRDSYANELLR